MEGPRRRGDFTIGRFQHDVKQGVVVHRDGLIRSFDWDGDPAWTYDNGLRGGDTYAHEIMRGDADGDGRDEIFVNMQRLTLALRGDGTLLWEDKTLRLHAVGILAWYDYPISTGPLEGTNNKIKT